MLWMNWMSEWFEWMMWITSEWNRLQFYTWEIGHWCVLWKIHGFVLILAQSGCYFHATFWVLLNDIPASNPLKGNHWICETTKFWLSIIKLTVKCESFVWTKQNVKRWKPDSQWNNLSSPPGKFYHNSKCIPLEHLKNIYKLFRLFIFHWLKIDRIEMDLLFSQWKHLAFVSLVSLNISLAFL